MDRAIDFFRDRHMLCGLCRHQWVATLEWIEQWPQAEERCPGCEVTCEAENGPRVTVDPDDPSLRDDNVARFAWYHSSTHSNWPARDYDPAAGLTEDGKRMMGGDGPVARYVEQQKAKALHIGTYNAAVHNMLRRIADQSDHGRQFYLYRVYLAPTVTVREKWIPDPGNFVGDVPLAEVCPPGVGVARYLNGHEDPGGISLALGRTAIACTQGIAVPLLSDNDPDWLARAVGEIETAAAGPPPPASRDLLGRLCAPAPERDAAHDLAATLAQRLPVNLRGQFETAVAFNGDLEPEKWARYALGLANMVLMPEQVLAELDRVTAERL